MGTLTLKAYVVDVDSTSKQSIYRLCGQMPVYIINAHIHLAFEIKYLYRMVTLKRLTNY